MSRSSGEGFLRGDRAAVEPLAALVAVLAVGAALGVYTVALDDAAPDRERPTAETTLDRVEPVVTRGGIVEPERLRGVDEFRYAATVTIEADGKTWRVRSGDRAPAPTTTRRTDAVAVAERTVTVGVGPGQNDRGTLRAVVYR
ncbi:hypothetical protein DJ71_26125 [Halorubrum sp. E3]|uniref:Uncharacterized protein n=1 Tax=Halorubrum persicum TaxID=1383844 RepID=A0A2G1WLV6_9EURY|nr:hypothetical protein [Halorubrum persicum]OYR57779.1 hypothetical protein DJ71_26125 [Halorubrum sp. E3]PHQ39994.1 hypothetical protein DJ69_03220 [Halorubrum persicum]